MSISNCPLSKVVFERLRQKANVCFALHTHREKKMNKIVMILLSIFLPPIAVFLKEGVGMQLLLNILLCIVFFFPGVVHALWLNMR